MNPEVTYRVVELLDRKLGQIVYEVWSGNPKTGYQWLVAEFNTRKEARECIQRRLSKEVKQ